MSNRKLRMVARNGKLIALYSDEAVPVLRKLSGRVTYGRFSHINPTPDGQHFQIDWVDEDVIAVLGERTTVVDGHGRPFATKGQAERHEVTLLKERYFKFKKDCQDERDCHDGPIAGQT